MKIYNGIDGEYRELVDFIVNQCKVYKPADKVILFGSIARGDYEYGKSDIDLCLISKVQNTIKLRDSNSVEQFQIALFNKSFDSFESNDIHFDFDFKYFGFNDLGRLYFGAVWREIEKDGIVLYDEESEII